MKRVDKTLYPVHAGAWSGGRIRFILKRGGAILRDPLGHKFTDEVEDAYSGAINTIWYDLICSSERSRTPLLVQRPGGKQ